MKTINAVELINQYENKIEYAAKFGRWLIDNEVCFNKKHEGIIYYEFGGEGLGRLASMDNLIEMFNETLYLDSKKIFF